MANKQPHPQRCEPKLYTESDMRRIQRHALMELEKHHMKLAIGSFALALHRKLGLDKDQMAEVLAAVNEISHEALCFTDVKHEIMDETGLDIDVFVEFG
ncbi:MAG: hypothetical protein IIZ93_00730 [Acidaminococcaceae bacterium]|nr:hypothetical protein [Acidaminococcaceae bacterium]